jgi:hypothetical protein
MDQFAVDVVIRRTFAEILLPEGAEIPGEMIPTWLRNLQPMIVTRIEMSCYQRRASGSLQWVRTTSSSGLPNQELVPVLFFFQSETTFVAY